ncbi:hypothetical protein KC726_00700 [Candidatus Woesebacteria bacterium]|nr:hypothetical protein [Candidatus Woesebacteria bacterium]
MKTLLIIDAHAMIHRAFHALPELTSKDGTPTNAIYGYFLMLLNAIHTLQPSHIIVTFDTPAPTFRKKLFSEYRANRPPTKEALKIQIPIIRTMTEHAGLTAVSQEGYEADDLIGSVVHTFKNGFDKIQILSGDKDLFQLVERKVEVVMPKRGISSFIVYTPDAVVKKMFVKPDQIADLKAIAGDSSDNYSGINGIGPKTASKLFEQFPHVEDAYKHIEKVVPEKLKKALEEYESQVALCKKLATIVQTISVDINLIDARFIAFDEALKNDLITYNLDSLLHKLYEPQKKKKKEKKEKKPAQTEDQMGLF